jgi:hypothetical protein
MKTPARLTLLSVLLLFAIGAQAYNLDWICVSSGGSLPMTSGGYRAMLTSGQPVAGACGSSGYVAFFGFWQPVLVSPTAAEEIESPDLPIKFSLEQNYPNPFNPTTAIEFSLPRSGWARLKVYDILGRLVTVLVDESLPAGAYRVIWDGRDLNGSEVASGIFLYRLEASDLAMTKKMLLLK